MGNTGAAYPLMLLVAALEEAKAGDRLLVASYGSGCDAFIMGVKDGSAAAPPDRRRGMKGHLATRKVIDDYRTYLQWRGLLVFEAQPTPPGGFISSVALWRDRAQVLPLHGLKCRVCGGIHYPPQRVCPRCRAKDSFDEWSLSDKKGHLFTFSADNLCSRLEAPRVTAIVDFEGGGRMATMMTDRSVDDLHVGMPVEMSFRRKYRDATRGIHGYFWKAVPRRS